MRDRRLTTRRIGKFLSSYVGISLILVFVSSASIPGGPVLIRVSGRSLLCHRLRVHHSGRLSTSARSQRPDRRPPPSPHLQDRQLHLWKRCSHPPTLGWPSPRNSPRASHSVREPVRYTLLRLPGHARQAMVEPLRFNGLARDRDRTHPDKTTKIGWVHLVVL